MIGFRDAVRGSLALALALALSLSAGASRAGPVDDFYRGRTLNFYVGAAPGGGYDITARLMANHFGRFIPGNPSVVVKNMPGASSLQLANYMYNTAPKDGSEIGMPQNTIAFEPLFKLLSKSGGNVQFDPHKYGWIGNPVVESMVVISWHTAALHSYKDLLDKSSIFGASGTETDNAILPTILKRTTGAKLQIVPGYQGPNDLFIALERGEIDAIGATGYSGLVATKGAWLRDRKINVLMQFGMKADPRIPDVPMALDVASSAQDRAALELIFGKYQLSRSVFAPPGVPAERLAALREAFDKMTADAGFRADAGRMGLDITLVRGEEIDAIIDKTYAAEPKVIERARELVEPLK